MVTVVVVVPSGVVIVVEEEEETEEIEGREGMMGEEGLIMYSSGDLPFKVQFNCLQTFITNASQSPRLAKSNSCGWATSSLLIKICGTSGLITSALNY